MLTRLIVTCCLAAFAKTCPAQTSSPVAAVEALFEGIREADTATAKRAFAPGATIQSVTEFGGRAKLSSLSLDEFLAQLGSMRPGMAEERTGDFALHRDGHLAAVWMPYAFYVDGAFTHCGTNLFTLVEGREGWRILSAIDTRSPGECPPLSNATARPKLDSLIDAWHRAAATADEDVFFGTMSADGIYLGTDATERWLRDSMQVWAAPYFDREVAWAFTPRERNWMFSDDGAVAWFDEHLDSWMGVVRGSGVLTKVDGQWKLRHYNLALAVPNERMDDVRVAIDSTAVRR